MHMTGLLQLWGLLGEQQAQPPVGSILPLAGQPPLASCFPAAPTQYSTYFWRKWIYAFRTSYWSSLPRWPQICKALISERSTTEWKHLVIFTVYYLGNIGLKIGMIRHGNQKSRPQQLISKNRWRTLRISRQWTAVLRPTRREFR